MNDPSKMLTTKEFADKVGLVADTIKGYCQNGTIDATKVGGRNGIWLISKAEVKRFQNRSSSPLS